jgi:MioC protein
MKISILFATETGSAETLADDLRADLALMHEVTVTSLAEFNVAAPNDADLLLVLASTYGDGELPSLAHRFYKALGSGGRPLSGRHFAVFGLGDKQYADTFGNASGLIEARMIEAGAIVVHDREVHDASGPEFMDDQARRWCAEVLRKRDSSITA